jgi:hypothetical protein
MREMSDDADSSDSRFDTFSDTIGLAIYIGDICDQSSFVMPDHDSAAGQRRFQEIHEGHVRGTAP